MPKTSVLKPDRIFAEVEACPPLMRDEAKSRFIGREVDWTLVFADGWQEPAGLARLTFRQQRSIVQFVAATVPLTDCPWLKHLHAGEIMRVRGRIAELDQLTITLKGASVSQVVEAAHCPPRQQQETGWGGTPPDIRDDRPLTGGDDE